MYLHHNIENDLVIDIDKIKQRGKLIDGMKHRFHSYGYNEIYTSTFEHYDLYAKMNGSVNRQEMIKTIDNNGNVLVLRPDITIPITQQLAMNNEKLVEDLRYFYTLDVYRQAETTNEYIESTQAGIEYFGNDSPEADSEAIAVAAHMLQDLQVEEFKIEIGHAGFFQKIIDKMDVEREDLDQLIHLIQAKNVAEIELLLQELSIEDDLKKIITALPFLYGKPETVLEKAKKLPLHHCLHMILAELEATYEILQAYELAQYLTIDFSLINQMDYYTGIIFQGFIPHIGKPVLMGGRYNTLANYFEANIPAIGFAANIELLLDGVEIETVSTPHVTILYEETVMSNAIQLARQLRDSTVQTTTYIARTEESRLQENTIKIFMKENEQYILLDDEAIPFQTVQGILQRLKERA